MNFLIFVVTAIISAYAIIWWRLVLPMQLSKRSCRILGVVFLILLVLQLGFRLILKREFSSAFQHPVTLFIFCLLGFTDILLFFTLLKDAVLILLQSGPLKKETPERRLFIQRAFNLVALSAATGATAWGTKTALKAPVLKKIHVPFQNLSIGLNGVRIVQISDLHVGSLISQDRVQKIVDRVNALEPDLIFFTGDVADGAVEDLKSSTEPLKNLKARYGKFYVTGNHEYYWDVDDWTKRLQELDFTYLYNEHRIVNIRGSRLLIGGVPDYMCQHIRPDHKSDPIGSLKDAPPSDLKILLAHQPKNCFDAFKAGYDLQMSGHTHNGQFFPNNLFIRFFHPYYKGLNLHENKMWVYVSAGTGFWGPPNV